MIDFVAHDLGRRLVEPRRVQVVRAGPYRQVDRVRRRERGASFLRTDGTVWTTDKLASSSPARLGILAVTGRTPSERYPEPRRRASGEPVYARIDVACSKDDKGEAGKALGEGHHGHRARR
jgi:phosphoglucomutase